MWACDYHRVWQGTGRGRAGVGVGGHDGGHYGGAAAQTGHTHSPPRKGVSLNSDKKKDGRVFLRFCI